MAILSSILRRSSLSALVALGVVLSHASTASAQDEAAAAETAPALPPPALPPPAPLPAPVPVVVAPSPAAPPASTPLAPPPAIAIAAPVAPPAPPTFVAGQSPDDVRFRDAHVDRVVLAPTAETHPKGTFYVSDYELLFLQLGYAVTDDLQLSVAGLLPVTSDQPLFFDFGAKLNVFRGEAFRAAVFGALDVVTSTTGRDDSAFAGRVGAVGQICFERTCQSSLSLTAGTLAASGMHKVLPYFGAAGFVLHASSRVSLLAEPSVVGATSFDGLTEGGALFAIGYGLRIAGPNFGLDLTFVDPIAGTAGGAVGSTNMPMGIPFVAFTYRTDGDAPSGARAVTSGAPVALPMSARAL